MEKLNEKQKKLLKQCKYYKGEEGYPGGVPFFYWEAEWAWVKHFERPEDTTEQFERLKDGLLERYGIPKSLLKSLYDMAEHIHNYDGLEPMPDKYFIIFVNGYMSSTWPLFYNSSISK